MYCNKITLTFALTILFILQRYVRKTEKEKASIDSVRRRDEKVWGFPALLQREGVHLSDDLDLCECVSHGFLGYEGGKLIPFS